jgi:hypothetical protein
LKILCVWAVETAVLISVASALVFLLLRLVSRNTDRDYFREARAEMGRSVEESRLFLLDAYRGLSASGEKFLSSGREARSIFREMHKEKKKVGED